MSTTFLGDNLHAIGDYSSRLFSVESRSAENLGDFVRRSRLDKGFSTTDVERHSRSGGAKGISDAYVTRIENGYVTNVSPEKLRALAKGLQVSEDELFAVARGKASPVRSVVITTQDVETRLRRRELMGLLFDDLPDDCQLDTLASLIGVHARRGLSLRIYERSGARSEAVSQISQLIRDLLPTAALIGGEGASGEDAEQRDPNVMDAPADELVPETTPQFSEDTEEDEERRGGQQKKGKNGTNGSEG